METIFTKIINGDIPSFKLAENDLFYAFLDIRPIASGHTLVVPKKEVDHFYDMDDVYLSSIFLFSKPIVKAIEAVVPCLRVGSIVAGLEVPHAHLHLVPIISMAEFNFSFAKEASSESLKQIQTKILDQLGSKG